YIPRNGDVVTEYNQVGAGTPTLKNSYVQGPGMDAKTTRISAAVGNPRTHYLGDAVGTLTTTLDDLGAATQQSLKDVWGNQISGSTSSERYGFAQREQDSESSLVYMRNRMYDPRTARFTQQDPAKSSGNPYWYVRNSPI